MINIQQTKLKVASNGINIITLVQYLVQSEFFFITYLIMSSNTQKCSSEVAKRITKKKKKAQNENIKIK